MYVSYLDSPHHKFLFRLVVSKNKLIVLDDAECVSTEHIFYVSPSTGNLVLQAEEPNVHVISMLQNETVPFVFSVS